MWIYNVKIVPHSLKRIKAAVAYNCKYSGCVFLCVKNFLDRCYFGLYNFSLKKDKAS